MIDSTSRDRLEAVGDVRVVSSIRGSVLPSFGLARSYRGAFESECQLGAQGRQAHAKLGARGSRSSGIGMPRTFVRQKERPGLVVRPGVAHLVGWFGT